MKRLIYACLTIVTTLSYFCVFGVEETEKQPLLPKPTSPNVVKRVLQVVIPSSQGTTEKIDWDMEIHVPQRRLEQLEKPKSIWMKIPKVEE